MFCRSCGKELSKKSVACIGCGMDPRDDSAYCPACGVETKDKQVICTACGASLEGGITDGWSTGAYIGLLVFSFFIPLIGWIYGGIQVVKSSPDSKRKKQAWHFIFSGVAGMLLNMLFLGAE
jgi:hypothetical protein